MTSRIEGLSYNATQIKCSSVQFVVFQREFPGCVRVMQIRSNSNRAKTYNLVLLAIAIFKVTRPVVRLAGTNFVKERQCSKNQPCLTLLDTDQCLYF